MGHNASFTSGEAHTGGVRPVRVGYTGCQPVGRRAEIAASRPRRILEPAQRFVLAWRVRSEIHYPLFGDRKGGMDARLKKVLDAQKRTVTVLSSLIAVQQALRYLPPESIPAVAEHTGASINDVYGVATFYTHFRFEPPGEHTVELCWGPTCQLFDSRGLMKIAEESTGITFDSTSEDRRYTLRGLECAGACAQAPAGKFDGKLIGQLTGDKLREALASMNGTKKG